MSDGFGTLVGGVTASVLFFFALFDLMRKVRDKTVESSARPALAVLFGAIIGYVGGRAAAIIGGPMVLALIAGHHVELVYTVDRIDNQYVKHCPSHVRFQGLIRGFDMMCGVSDELRQGLAAGTHIIVAGHGTRYGLFATSLRRYD